MDAMMALIGGMGLLSYLCFIVGFSLVVIEMFVPGFGIPGITGGLLLFIGILLTANSLMEGVILLIMILLVLGIFLSLIIRAASKGKLSNGVILKAAMRKEEGYIGRKDMGDFLGKEGIVDTTLRPSGRADFDGVKLDVVAESAFIPKGTKVKIIQIDGMKIIVRSIG